MKIKRYNKLLILDIEEKVKDWIKGKAKQEKCSMAEIVRRAIILFRK